MLNHFLETFFHAALIDEPDGAMFAFTVLTLLLAVLFYRLVSRSLIRLTGVGATTWPDRPFSVDRPLDESDSHS